MSLYTRNMWIFVGGALAVFCCLLCLTVPIWLAGLCGLGYQFGAHFLLEWMEK